MNIICYVILTLNVFLLYAVLRNWMQPHEKLFGGFSWTTFAIGWQPVKLRVWRRVVYVCKTGYFFFQETDVTQVLAKYLTSWTMKLVGNEIRKPGNEKL